MKNVLTLFKTPEFVRTFTRLESIHEKVKPEHSPAYVVNDLITFIEDFYDELFIEDSKDSETLTPNIHTSCDPDLNTYRLSKVVPVTNTLLEFPS